MRLILSGPMTGKPDLNFPAFQQAAKVLRRAGYDVCDPSERGVVPGWEWSDYLRRCLVDLVECDGVALLPSWTASRGARLEVHTADELGIPTGAVEWWLEESRRSTP